MKMHIAIDFTTGRSKARGKSGRWYEQAEIDRAQAARGGADDPEGAAFADDLDRSDWDDADLVQALRDELHDCPECRAALARGEVPLVGTFPMARPKKRRTTLRWREQRRRPRYRKSSSPGPH